MNKSGIFPFTIAAALAVSALTGCVYSSADFIPQQTNGAIVARPIRNAGDIVLVDGDVTNRRYDVVGRIEAYSRSVNLLSSDPTRADVDEALRTEAAKRGADAVMQVHYATERQGLASRGRMTATGIAVIFVD